MRNIYYIKRGEFANTYDLCYAPSNVKLSEEWERIPRRVAIDYARREADRREYDREMSGYAPQYILPHGKSEYDLDPYDEGVDYIIRDRIVIPL